MKKLRCVYVGVCVCVCVGRRDEGGGGGRWVKSEEEGNKHNIILSCAVGLKGTGFEGRLVRGSHHVQAPSL